MTTLETQQSIAAGAALFALLTVAVALLWAQWQSSSRTAERDAAAKVAEDLRSQIASLKAKLDNQSSVKQQLADAQSTSAEAVEQMAALRSQKAAWATAQRQLSLAWDARIVAAAASLRTLREADAQMFAQNRFIVDGRIVAIDTAGDVRVVASRENWSGTDEGYWAFIYGANRPQEVKNQISNASVDADLPKWERRSNNG